MRTILRVSIGIFALALLLTGTPAKAQEATSTATTTTTTTVEATIATDVELSALKTKIAELRAAHARLKAQVEAGTLTKEQARAEWKKLLEDFRAEKNQIFEKRIENIKKRLDRLSDKNSEKANILRDRFEANKARVEENANKRAEIKAKIDSGEITKKDAIEMRREVNIEQRTRASELRSQTKIKLDELRQKRQERRPIVQ